MVCGIPSLFYAPRKSRSLHACAVNLVISHRHPKAGERCLRHQLQSAGAGLAAGRDSLVLLLFCYCPCFYVSASVYSATLQSRSVNQSGLKHSAAGEVSAGSHPPDSHTSIREGMAQELEWVPRGRPAWLFQ